MEKRLAREEINSGQYVSSSATPGMCLTLRIIRVNCVTKTQSGLVRTLHARLVRYYIQNFT